jgi:hypothetical protein
MLNTALDPKSNQVPDPAPVQVSVNPGGPEKVPVSVSEAKPITQPEASTELLRSTDQAPNIDPKLASYVKVSSSIKTPQETLVMKKPNVKLPDLNTVAGLEQEIKNEEAKIGKDTSQGKNWLHSLLKSVYEKLLARKQQPSAV